MEGGGVAGSKWRVASSTVNGGPPQVRPSPQPPVPSPHSSVPDLQLRDQAAVLTVDKGRGTRNARWGGVRAVGRAAGEREDGRAPGTVDDVAAYRRTMHDPGISLRQRSHRTPARRPLSWSLRRAVRARRASPRLRALLPRALFVPATTAACPNVLRSGRNLVDIQQAPHRAPGPNASNRSALSSAGQRRYIWLLGSVSSGARSTRAAPSSLTGSIGAGLYGSPSSQSGGVDAMSIGESCDDTDAVDALERLGERCRGVWPVCECECEPECEPEFECEPECEPEPEPERKGKETDCSECSDASDAGESRACWWWWCCARAADAAYATSEPHA